MTVFWILLAVALLVLLVAFVCFYMAFFVPKHGPVPPDQYPVPEGEVYEPFRDKMIYWMKSVRALPHEDFYIAAFDPQYTQMHHTVYHCIPKSI